MPKHITPIAESNHFIILDTYTPKWEPVATSLTEGLPREIELRQKQYVYYRELLLSFPNNPLPASPFAGGGEKKEFFTPANSPFAGGELDALSLPPVKGGLRGVV